MKAAYNGSRISIPRSATVLIVLAVTVVLGGMLVHYLAGEPIPPITPRLFFVAPL